MIRRDRLEGGGGAAAGCANSAARPSARAADQEGSMVASEARPSMTSAHCRSPAIPTRDTAGNP